MSSNTTGVTLSRRQAMRAGAGAATAAVVYPHVDPVQDAEAIAPVVAAGGIAVGMGVSAAGGWALREFEILGSDDAAEGLTPSQLKQQSYRIAQVRRSTNGSTFTDNLNITTYIKEPALAEAKLAAVDAINQGLTESEVLAQANTAANNHFAMVEKNFLKSWNESVREAENLHKSAEEHPDLSATDVIRGVYDSGSGTYTNPISTGTSSTTLADGQSFEVSEFSDSNTTGTLSPLGDDSDWSDNGRDWRVQVTGADDSISYNKLGPGVSADTWEDVWRSIDSVHSSVMNNISVWVTNGYDAVQSGDIDPSQLLSPSDLSSRFANEESAATAVADLLSLNIPVDTETEVTIEINDQWDTNLTGVLACTTPDAVARVDQGDTIDPNATDSNGDPLYGNWYIVYNPRSWSITSTIYDDSYGLQGGEIRLNSDPSTLDGADATGNVVYQVTLSSNGATATFTPSDATESDDGSYWTVDLSGQLSSNSGSIESMTGYRPDDYAEKNRSLIIDNQFTVVESDGTVTFDPPREPQEDNNYLTEEEWRQNMDATRDQIEKYEDSQSGGGSIFGGLFEGGFGGDIKKWVLIGGGGLLLYAFISGD